MQKILEKSACRLYGRNQYLYFFHRHYHPSIGEENFNFFRYDFKKRIKIDSETYLLSIFGKAARGIVSVYGDRTALDISWGRLSDGSIITNYYQERVFYRFDPEGHVVWKTDKLWDLNTVYSIAIQENSIWCAIPTCHTIKRYSLDTFKEEISIGDNDYSDRKGKFDYPEDVFYKDGRLYVSDMGNKRVCVVHPGTGEVGDLMNFDESVWAFRIFDGRAYVRLDSGYYMV